MRFNMRYHDNLATNQIKTTGYVGIVYIPDIYYSNNNNYLSNISNMAGRYCQNSLRIRSLMLGSKSLSYEGLVRLALIRQVFGKNTSKMAQ